MRLPKFLRKAWRSMTQTTFTQTDSTATATVAAPTATLTGVDTGTDMTAAQAATIVADIRGNKSNINEIIDALQNAGIVI